MLLETNIAAQIKLYDRSGQGYERGFLRLIRGDGRARGTGIYANPSFTRWAEMFIVHNIFSNSVAEENTIVLYHEHV